MVKKAARGGTVVYEPIQCRHDGQEAAVKADCVKRAKEKEIRTEFDETTVVS
jgi:hypothetical protein